MTIYRCVHVSLIALFLFLNDMAGKLCYTCVKLDFHEGLSTNMAPLKDRLKLVETW